MPTTETKYIEAVGRRKTAVARVRIYPGAKPTFTVNNKELALYFPTRELQRVAQDSFAKAESPEKFKVTVVVRGGGSNAQAEAIRHGIARALIAFDPDIRKKIKKFDLLKRDPRSKERRKFGLKKARKAPQWSKR
ncbi:MAG: 30S ribosomal protein S9 [Patescibacteria group bacterium]